MTKKILSLILLTLLTTAACNQKEPVKGTPEAGADLTVPEFTWKVRNQPQLDTIYMTSGMVLNEEDRLEGFVGKDALGNYVIYTRPPKYVDDDVACTLGHEVMHIVLGSYHEDTKGD